MDDHLSDQQAGANAMNASTSIMIVEDEHIIAWDLQTTLQELGYTVSAIVSSGEMVLQKLAETPPDLVLMDIHLKGELDGIMVATQIRAQYDIPVIYLTSYSDQNTLERAQISEPFGYLLKPFEERELHISIEMALYKHRTERMVKHMERRLLDSQRLESIGVLAGGIAHDFNNLLMTIIGNADLVASDRQTSAMARLSIDQIQLAARRASDLVQQLLAYAGKGFFVTESLDLSELIDTAHDLFDLPIMQQVPIRYELAGSLPLLRGDATQLRQAFLYLITNAIEACSETNGSVTVTTGQMVAGPEYLETTLGGHVLAPGQFLFLEVSDTGIGMESATQARIFEPFYTTKFLGRGLGLAAVLGIVRRHGGMIRVESAPGQGSRFRLLFPLQQAVEPAQPSPAPVAEQTRGTVLVIDDEEAIRAVASRMLKRAGYDVQTASDGQSGIAQMRAHAEQITCVLLDLSMPRTNIDIVITELMQIKPQVRIVLMSGYSQEDALERFRLSGTISFLPKPFNAAALERKIQPD